MARGQGGLPATSFGNLIDRIETVGSRRVTAEPLGEEVFGAPSYSLGS
jgi:hypothetical protein